MKKVVKTVVMASMLISLLVSCTDHGTEQSITNTESSVAYYCPMECEGDVTYDNEGSCPVCHMDLVEVK